MIIALCILCIIVSAWGQEYQGCFYTSASELVSAFNRLSTPRECQEECRSRYYMYAGLTNGQQCFCISALDRQSVSNACTITCTADPNNYCGTKNATSVYSTGQTGPSPPRKIHLAPIKPNGIQIMWEPPDIPNGVITSYNLQAIATDMHSSLSLPTMIEIKVEGGSSNATALMDLQFGTEYNISLTASNLKGTSDPVYASERTFIGPPRKPLKPVIIDQTDKTITILLSKGFSENGPVSVYQVVVVQDFIIPPTENDVAYTNYEKSIQQGLGYYIAGEFDASDFSKYEKFTVGNDQLIGGYRNVPLENYTVPPKIGTVVVSKMRGQAQYSYSDLASGEELRMAEPRKRKFIVTILYVAIFLSGALLLALIVLYFTLKQRHERFVLGKLPEQQELTLQGPVYEVDNVAYIPDDMPETTNHYQELKNKVWTVPQSALNIDTAIMRRGRFGTVHTGTVQKDGQIHNAAVHCIADGMLKSSEKKHMLRELDACIRVPSMNYIAGFVGTCETFDKLYVVLELPMKTLKNRLLAARSGDTFPVNQILPIGASIASALEHLENYKIIHTHLCARNIGLTHDWHPKLMGHGLSKYALEDVKYARWTAIECFDNQTKHQPGAVWALAVVIWEMLSFGGTPYSNLTLDSEVEAAIGQGVRLPQLPDTPDPLYEVMLTCWQENPEERPTYDELKRLNTLSLCPITSIAEPYHPELELN